MTENYCSTVNLILVFCIAATDSTLLWNTYMSTTGFCKSNYGTMVRNVFSRDIFLNNNFKNFKLKKEYFELDVFLLIQ